MAGTLPSKVSRFYLTACMGYIFPVMPKSERSVTSIKMYTIASVGKKAPQIGDHCFIGAGATIVGDIRIGDFVKIGAGAVVFTDVPKPFDRSCWATAHDCQGAGK